MKHDIEQLEEATCLSFAFEQNLDHDQIIAMAQVVENAMQETRDLRLLLDLRETESFTMGALFSPKGFLASLKSIGPVSRYAVVSAPALAAAAVEAFGAILPLEARSFSTQDIGKAHAWVCAPDA